MTNIPDEQILEFIHAKEMWVWNDDPNRAVIGTPKGYHIDIDYPFRVQLKGGNFYNGKHFSLEKPQVYEDGAWYAATIKNPYFLTKDLKSMFLYNDGIFETLSIRARDVAEFREHQLTNIRHIPKELWEGEG